MTLKYAPSVLCALVLAGCASPSVKLARMYVDLQRDAAAQSNREHDDAHLRERQKARAETARAIVEAHGVESAADFLHAAVILVETDSDENLDLAQILGLKAAELGEDKGFRVAAEAIDKQLVKQGMHQRFGTQYVYEPVLKSWRLYPCDPRTTDAERKAMGVPPLEELMRAQDVLNAHAASGSPVATSANKAQTP